MSTSKLCAPCNLSDKQAENANWCFDCEVFLCAGCSSYHKTLPPLRHHQLVDISVFLSTDVDVLSNKCPLITCLVKRFFRWTSPPKMLNSLCFYRIGV